MNLTQRCSSLFLPSFFSENSSTERTGISRRIGNFSAEIHGEEKNPITCNSFGLAHISKLDNNRLSLSIPLLLVKSIGVGCANLSRVVSSSIEQTSLSKKRGKREEKEWMKGEERRRKERGKERDGWLQLSLMAEESMFVTLRLCKLDAAFT